MSSADYLMQRKQERKAPRPYFRPVVRIDIPDDVLFDRDIRLNMRRDLTAELLGDPPPGYSALDRRGD